MLWAPQRSDLFGLAFSRALGFSKLYQASPMDTELFSASPLNTIRQLRITIQLLRGQNKQLQSNAAETEATPNGWVMTAVLDERFPNMNVNTYALNMVLNFLCVLHSGQN